MNTYIKTIIHKIRAKFALQIKCHWRKYKSHFKHHTNTANWIPWLKDEGKDDTNLPCNRPCPPPARRHRWLIAYTPSGTCSWPPGTVQHTHLYNTLILSHSVSGKHHVTYLNIHTVLTTSPVDVIREYLKDDWLTCVIWFLRYKINVILFMYVHWGNNFMFQV